jgi:hypothetical protein
MHQVTTDHLAELLTDHEPPCISLYQPTHRYHPDNQQDAIRYRNLLRTMEASLLQKYPTREVKTLVEKFQALAHDTRFWNRRTDGLAILGTTDTFQIFDLQQAVPELLVVANSFHLKPLLRLLQSADRYQILCLDRHEARLYEGNRDALDPIELMDFPSTITEALGNELTEPHETVASYGLGAGKDGKEMHHGHGAKKDEVDIDRDRFFRVIDRAVLEHYSRPSGLPLILAALAEYQAPFREISHNPHLLHDGIVGNPNALGLDQLRAEAWRTVEPFNLQRLAKLIEDHQIARSRNLGSDDLAQVAQATMAGRVATLLVEADREIPGRIDAATGNIELGDIASPEVGDILNDLAESVLQRKGAVVVVPVESMPSATGVAATYRY